MVVFSDDDGGYPTDCPILITDDKELADALVDKLHWAINKYSSLVNDKGDEFEGHPDEECFEKSFGEALSNLPKALRIVKVILSRVIKFSHLDAYRITVDDPLVIYWGGVVKNKVEVVYWR